MKQKETNYISRNQIHNDIEILIRLIIWRFFFFGMMNLIASI